MTETRRFCEQCGKPLKPGARFCESCGAAVADAAPVAEPVGAPAAAVHRKRRGPGKGSIVLLVVLALLATGASAGASFVYGDDFRLPRLGIPSWDEVQAELPFLLPAGEVTALDDEELAAFEEEEPLGGVSTDHAAQEGRIRAQLAGLGLPITSVAIFPAADGSRVLTVGVDYGKLASLGTGIDAGLDALVSIVSADQVDVTGLQHVTMIVHDESGAGLFGIAVPVSAVEQRRAGTLDDRGLVRATGVSVYNRLALAQAIQDKLGQ